MAKLLVLPDRRIRAWRSEDDPEIASFDMVDASEALSKKWRSHAHCTSYEVRDADGETISPISRLSKVAPFSLAADGFTVWLTWLHLDFDVDELKHGGGVWTDALWQEHLDRLHALYVELGASPAIYRTFGGYHAMWPLTEPVEAAYADSFIAQFHDYVRDLDLDLDPDPAAACWNNLYCLPRVVRPYKNSFRKQDFADFLEFDYLDWEAPEELTLGPVRRASSVDWGSEAPAVGSIKPDWRSLTQIKHRARLKAGRPFARKGQRHGETLSLAGAIAYKLEEPDPEIVYQYLAPSVLAQQDKDTEESQALTKLWATCCYVCDCELGRREEETEQRESTKRTLGEQMSVPESEAENHLVISHGPAYYVWDKDKAEWGETPYNTIKLARELDQKCEGLAYIYSPTGALLSDRELIKKYSTEANGVAYDWAADDNTYDYETKQLVLKAGAMRHLEPYFDQKIDTWLKALGGKWYPNLIDWLSAVPDPTLPICVLYIDGVKDAGKSLLAKGLSRLYVEGANKFAGMFSRFNLQMLKSPLFEADESVETDGKQIVHRLKEWIGLGRTFALEPKGREIMQLHGNIRILITANDEMALGIRHAFNSASAEALEQRMGYLHAGNEAAEYLRTLGKQFIHSRWIEQSGIAKHALWLAENHTATTGNEKLHVGGFNREAVHFAYSAGGAVGLLLAAILKGLTMPPRATSLVVKDGAVWINVDDIRSKWDILAGKQERVPRPMSLRQMVETLSDLGSSKFRANKNENPRHRWGISKTRLIMAADMGAGGDVLTPEEVEDYFTKHETKKPKPTIRTRRRRRRNQSE